MTSGTGPSGRARKKRRAIATIWRVLYPIPVPKRGLGSSGVRVTRRGCDEAPHPPWLPGGPALRPLRSRGHGLPHPPDALRRRGPDRLLHLPPLQVRTLAGPALPQAVCCLNSPAGLRFVLNKQLLLLVPSIFLYSSGSREICGPFIF